MTAHPHRPDDPARLARPDAAVSVVIIAGNEATAIARCLESVAWAAEIVVVCSGSDATADIARRYTDRVFEHPFRGYADQRALALSYATCPWVIGLDADETVPPVLADEIRRVVTSAPAPAGFAIPRRNYFRGQWVRFGGQYPDWQIRLARRDVVSVLRRPVHERFQVPGELGRLENPIEHHSRDTVGPVLEKQLRYAYLEALGKYGRRRANWATLLFRPLTAFLHVYVRQQGFRDGYAGLVLALIHAMSQLQVQIFMWEMKTPRSPPRA
jgi:glycosyltransferase involved in cell wall biosynthesis